MKSLYEQVEILTSQVEQHKFEIERQNLKIERLEKQLLELKESLRANTTTETRNADFARMNLKPRGLR